MSGHADDAFAILGLPRRFDLSREQIDRAHRAMAAANHPDRAADAIEAAEFQRAAARLNQARRTLIHPELRADELLRSLGGPAKEDDKSLPDGFLVEMMERREEMEAAAGDEAADRHWQDWTDKQHTAYVGRVAALFASLGDVADPQVLREIRRELNAWRYIERLIEQNSA